MSQPLPRFSVRTLLTVIVTITCSQLMGGDLLTIELKQTATVVSPQVLLRDVAKVRSRAFSDQMAAEVIELRLLDLAFEEETINAQSIRTRIVLAGWSIDDIRIIGAKEVRVSYHEPEPLTDTEIEDAALEAAFAVIGGDKEDISVKLQGVFVQSLPPNIRDLDGLMAQVTPPPTVGPGRNLMQIQIWDGDQIVATRSAAFDVRRRQTVAVAKVSLTRDKPIDEQSVKFERRFVSATLDELDASQVFGQRVRSNVVAGTILQARDFQTTHSGARILIKRGDLVSAYTRAGRLETRLRNMEAMQDAGLGDTIKLMNRDSDNLVSGKVVGPGTVRVVVER
ncbi:MAG: flagellar basal body P-ring formation chaperone FlgA [Planctomycetaceae bacterium]